MSRKLQTLQILRGVAFLLIFISHCSFLTTKTNYWGAFGVSIFIILSGFLAIYTDSNRSCIENLWIKIKKLFPLHISTLLVALPISGIIDVISGNNVWKFVAKLFLNITMLQGFIPSSEVYFSFNAVAWYLTLVIVFSVMTRPLIRIINKLCKIRGGGYYVALLISIQIIWTLAMKNSSIMHWAVYINPIFRLVDYTIGIWLGKYYLDNPDRFNLKRSICVIPFIGLIIIIVFVSCFVPENNAWFLCVVWTPLSALCISLCLLFENKLKTNNGFMIYIGNRSMELFLIHYLVIRYWTAIIDPQEITIEILSILICLGISIGIANLWRHVIKLRRSKVR